MKRFFKRWRYRWVLTKRTKVWGEQSDALIVRVLWLLAVQRKLSELRNTRGFT